MPVSAALTNHAAGDVVQHTVLRLTTRHAMEFVDVTARLRDVIAESDIVEGLLMVQSRHTTTGLLINEDEPLLLEDLAELFERLVPAGCAYRHDDFHRRFGTLTSTERVNGHAHCRAALLRTSESLAVTNGALALGRWQRVFFVDFDGGQQREVWLTLLGRRTRAHGAPA
jgi:secondary thiamine-phosphate synthase enzyme